MDGLGTQARQAARTEPAAARRDRHELSWRSTARAPAVPAGVRYVITLDADTRLPRGRGAAAGRQDGASAQPPAVRRRASAASSRGTHSAAARHAVPARSAARDRCFSACSPAPAASIRMPLRSPTSIRICSAKARIPARASMTSMPSKPRSPAVFRKHAAQPRSVRGNICPRRPGFGRRSGRGISVALRRRCRAPAPLGARRLAVAAVDLRPRGTRRR